MKKHFFMLLLIFIAFVSLVALYVSHEVTARDMRHLLLERAEYRLAMIVWGFNATAANVDIYSQIEFDFETLTIATQGITVLQYGTASLNLHQPGLHILRQRAGSYDFTLYINLQGEMDKYLQPIRTVATVVGIIYAALFLVFGWIFVHMVIDPIEKLAREVDAIRSRNLTARIAVPSRKDEMRRLVIAFNAMLDDIAGTYARQVRFLEDMAHDIATPVQILEGYRQLIERHGADSAFMKEYFDVAKIQLSRLKDMTGSMKTALAAERVRRMEHADATSITEHIINYYRELYPNLIFTADIAADVIVALASEDLERIENILIDNAVKYGGAGGRIDIRLTQNEFSVKDYGIGIAAHEKEAIFNRYHRAPQTSATVQGSGIGLSILKRFSEEYDFTIQLESHPGKGSTFLLRFQSRPLSV